MCLYLESIDAYGVRELVHGMKLFNYKVNKHIHSIQYQPHAHVRNNQCEKPKHVLLLSADPATKHQSVKARNYLGAYILK